MNDNRKKWEQYDSRRCLRAGKELRLAFLRLNDVADGFTAHCAKPTEYYLTLIHIRDEPHYLDIGFSFVSIRIIT
jgi:hypothetical protein